MNFTRLRIFFLSFLLNNSIFPRPCLYIGPELSLSSQSENSELSNFVQAVKENKCKDGKLWSYRPHWALKLVNFSQKWLWQPQNRIFLRPRLATII